MYRELLNTYLVLGLFFLTSPASAADIDLWITTQLSELTGLYQQLHRQPELSFQEKETSSRIAEQLSRVGADVTTGVGGHGVVGILRNGTGDTLLLRTDLDALPIEEETGLPYASKVRVDATDGRGKVGVMHACGHDVHMTIFVGVARYLATHREQWRGRLMLVAQPAEEHLAGAQAMLDDGLYERFGKPDYALALHVAADIPAGMIGWREGFMAAASDSVDITLYGKGGHGALPHQAVDPIVQAAQLIMALQTIVARETDPSKSAVVTVGSIHAGTAHNIIPDECELQLTVRSYAPEVRGLLRKAIQRKAEGIARSMDARMPRVKITPGADALYNAPALAQRVVPSFRKVLGAQKIIETPSTMGSEDFAMFAQGGVPIFMFGLGTASPAQVAKQTHIWPLHSSQYQPDLTPTLRTGIKAMSAAALELLPRR